MVSGEQQNSMGSVAIVASEVRDATLVEALLKNTGVDTTSMQICNAQQLSTKQTFAIVVCHRKSENAAQSILANCTDASRLIVLSDCTSESTVVNLLEHGARHVFDIGESTTLLQARLEAALRQHSGSLSNSFTVDDIHFDFQKRTVSRDGELIDLSPKEFEFANRIFSNIDEIVKNSDLMTSIWSLPQHMDTRRIDTAACRVRKKLRLFSDEGWLLKRIRCVGYRLTRVNSEA